MSAAKKLEDLGWTYVGSGTTRDVFLSPDKKVVAKIAHNRHGYLHEDHNGKEYRCGLAGRARRGHPFRSVPYVYSRQTICGEDVLFTEAVQLGVPHKLWPAWSETFGDGYGQVGLRHTTSEVVVYDVGHDRVDF